MSTRAKLNLSPLSMRPKLEKKVLKITVCTHYLLKNGKMEELNNLVLPLEKR